jgi:hypothetical protein
MSSGKYYIENGYIYGPKMSGKFYIENNYIYGPQNSGKYYIQEIIYGGQKKAENSIYKTITFGVPMKNFHGLKINGHEDFLSSNYTPRH